MQQTLFLVDGSAFDATIAGLEPDNIVLLTHLLPFDEARQLVLVVLEINPESLSFALEAAVDDSCGDIAAAVGGHVVIINLFTEAVYWGIQLVPVLLAVFGHGVAGRDLFARRDNLGTLINHRPADIAVVK